MCMLRKPSKYSFLRAYAANHVTIHVTSKRRDSFQEIYIYIYCYYVYAIIIEMAMSVCKHKYKYSEVAGRILKIKDI
jgi:hypothetical protein